MEHENDPDIDEPYVPPTGNVLSTEEQSLSQPAPEPSKCKIFSCSVVQHRFNDFSLKQIQNGDKHNAHHTQYILTNLFVK